MTPHSPVEYRHNQPLDPLDVVRVFDNSGLKRPTTDLPRIARMFAAPALTLSAWIDGRLVGLPTAATCPTWPSTRTARAAASAASWCGARRR
jgi:hypothetical protein